MDSSSSSNNKLPCSTECSRLRLLLPSSRLGLLLCNNRTLVYHHLLQLHLISLPRRLVSRSNSPLLGLHVVLKESNREPILLQQPGQILLLGFKT
jgi:hypothetical protein